MRNEFKFDQVTDLPPEFARRLSDPTWDRTIAAGVLKERARRASRTRALFGGGLSAAAALIVALFFLIGNSDDTTAIGGYAAAGTMIGPLLQYATASAGQSEDEGSTRDVGAGIQTGTAGGLATAEPAPAADREGLSVDQMTDETSELALDDAIDDAMDQHMLLASTE